jgi:hypothetical protein
MTDALQDAIGDFSFGKRPVRVRAAVGKRADDAVGAKQNNRRAIALQPKESFRRNVSEL